ncbi:MAG: DUF2270 domain-containing protein [Hyphomicrobiaceae bacterium]|nr:DUF2270 domain-containing protein [Hyphomicrobiaceae bacterium]
MDEKIERRPPEEPDFTSAEIGAIAHLYRGEVYRSTIWRTRLDATTNWAVATLGIALSVTFSSPDASPLPLLLVGLLCVVFLVFEARRYRYFNVWRARARWLEKHFYAPLLRHGSRDPVLTNWPETLADDYVAPRHHITVQRAIGRRLRRNYVWIFGIQAMAYYGKILIHPTPIESLDQLWSRAAVGPVSGEIVIFCGLFFNLGWIAFAVWHLRGDMLRHRDGDKTSAMG